MTDVPPQLPALTEAQRIRALERFSMLRPALEDGISQTEIASNHDLPLRTIQRWVNSYRQHRLPPLARKDRSDQRKRPWPPPALLPSITGAPLHNTPKTA